MKSDPGGIPNISLSFLVPAYNESATVGGVVTELKQRYPNAEILVIDDGSKDDTGRIAESAGAKVITHPYNIGNGAAVKSGIRASTGDILVFMDADFQHHPVDVELLLKYLPQYDMVGKKPTSPASAPRSPT